MQCSPQIRRGSRGARAAEADFDIDNTFENFMAELGGTPTDARWAVVFTGRDPIVRSHFRIGACMAVPAMAAALGAAAIWRDRTGEGQDLRRRATVSASS